MGNITGKEYPLKTVFSEKFEYFIPNYQRPYAWTSEETEILFDNLYSFYTNEDKQKGDSYFLGSIVLIKEDEDIPSSQVVDGQQRITTLTILFASILSRLGEVNKHKYMKYLGDECDEVEHIKEKHRLHLRDKDQPFFNQYIQELKLNELVALDPKQLDNESKQHIRENCKILLDKIDEKFLGDENKLLKFLGFIVSECYVVVVSVTSAQFAFRVFSVMNSTGLDLMPTDIIKSEVIGDIDDEDLQQKYTDKWEDLEDQTTRSGFNDLFSHIRMIFAKTKAQKSLLEEFRTYVLNKKTSVDLIDNILEPYADAYSTLKKKNYKHTNENNAKQINQCLFWLNKIDNDDWMPSAIKFFADNKNDSDYILWFVRKLERLASYLHITEKNVNNRIERYKCVLEEMEENPDHSIIDPLESIELSNKEKEDFVKALDGEIYLKTGVRRNYIILKLNEFVADNGIVLDFEPSVLTIEHVLPQTVSSGSEWETTWPDPKVRVTWLNKIANLVPLTRKKNSKASNYDFGRKKTEYFQNDNDTTTYPLTIQVLNKSEWTPGIVQERQKNLIDVFINNWDLSYPSSSDDENVVEYDAFYINKRGASAEGTPTETGFVVKQGSQWSEQVVDAFETKNPNAYRIREELKNSIVVNGSFLEDYEFDNSSIAASTVLGRNANGPKEWKTETGVKFVELTSIENDLQKSFNVDDESTYIAKKTGPLAYELIKHLFESNKLSEEEIELLKTRDYTAQLFSETKYPVLADSVDDNRGNSNVKRYKTTPIMHNGTNIYVTTQWYKENRSDLIIWYKQHL